MIMSSDTTANESYEIGLLKAFGALENDWVETGEGVLVKKNDSIEDTFGNYSEIWIDKPPTLKMYFKDWFPEPLYPIQYNFCKAMMGEDPLVWCSKYDEGHAFWGKGGGKDRTIAKLLVYIIVKLLHMVNPQVGLAKFIKEEGTIGLDSPIDLANVSKDKDQAKDVFFKNVKEIVKKVKNPKTGINFFIEKGVDIREGHDIQTDCIVFPHNITLHSLNSKTYAGEGLNLFVVVGDEIGASPAKQVRNQLESIRKTVISRFPKVGKVMLMSYKYDDNCPMTIEYKLGEKDERVFSSRAACYEVNPKKHKENYKRFYIQDPEKAQWTFECKETRDVGGGFIRQKFLVPWCFNDSIGENPFIGDITTTDNILSLQFKDWFFAKLQGRNCTIHIDLAKGKTYKGGDCVGISMVHPELMKPRIHSKAVSNLAKFGLSDIDVVNITDDERKGIVVDFMLRVVAPIGGEVQFSDIITYISILRAKGINIYKVTYDGWQSVGEIQRLENIGIPADNLSVDKDTAPYDTSKTLIYLGIIRGYEHPVTIREFKELIRNEKGKIDHPEVSWKRLQQEDIDIGSKDVSDSVAGASYTAMKEISIDCGIVF